MSLSITQRPNSLSLVRDGLIYKFNCSGYISNSGALATRVFVVTALPAVNSTITLEWGENSVTLTVKDTPNDSGVQVQRDTNSTQDQAVLLYQALRNNYTLQKDFNFSVAAATITATAKNKGDEYTLTVTDSPNWINPVAGVNGVDVQYAVDYELICMVYVNSVQVTELSLIPDSTGVVEIDLKKAVEPYLEYVWPNFSLVSPQQLSNFHLPVFVKAAEAFGDPFSVQKVLDDSSNIVNTLLGGTTREWRWSSNYKADVAEQVTFLTWQPLRKTIGLSQKEVLTFYVDQAGEYTVEASIKYTDGTKDAYEELFNDFYSLGRYLAFPVDFNRISTDIATPGKTIYSYTVRIRREADGETSEERLYIADRKYREQETEIHYMNSFGAMEVLRCFGARVDAVDVSKTDYAKFLDSDTQSEEEGGGEFNHLSSKSITLYTGFISKEELAHLEEFLLSRSKKLIIEGKRHSITVKSSSLVPSETRRTLNSYSFVVSPTINNNSYSK